MGAIREQYIQIKQRFPKEIVFYQLGEFYEMFDEDAKIISDLLGLTLTQRENIPMCGIPLSAKDTYIKKILQANYKIALCEQLETPQSKKNKIIHRDVTKIISTGTFVDQTKTEYNFMLSFLLVNKDLQIYEIAYGDLMTGEVFIEQCEKLNLISRIFMINPTEVVGEEKLDELGDLLSLYYCVLKQNTALELLQKYLESHGYNFEPKIYKQEKIQVDMGISTMRNLEIRHGLYTNSQCLYDLYKKTQTPGGKRVVELYLTNPLYDKNILNTRLDSLEFFKKQLELGIEIKLPKGDYYKKFNNLNNLENIWEFGNIMEQLINILNKNLPNELFLKKKFIKNIDIYKQIFNYISETEDGLIVYNDQYTNIIQQEKEIFDYFKSLGKIKNNQIIGYFLEFKNKQDNLIFKQYSGGNWRYTSEDILRKEILIKEYKEQKIFITNTLIQELKNKIYNYKDDFYELFSLISLIDYYQTCAHVSYTYNFQRPIFIDEKKIIINNGFHPLIQTNFVKNSLYIDDFSRIQIITGPNMGGKSTYIRQIALMVWMAQVGLFVPGEFQSYIWEKIFIRIGSADNISSGESTFFLEMKEIGEMIDKANEKSLIFIDEIGRGTSIEEGIVLSKAIIQYIYDHIRCFAFIVTHYKEITQINLPCLVNKQLLTKNGILLYLVQDGISQFTYAINVIKKLNYPEDIINQASRFLNDL